MARKKLTAQGVEAIKPAPEGKRVEVWDVMLPGFGVRVTDKGRKSWVVMYRVNGRQRRYTIGPYPALKLGEAREKAREALRQVAEGRDPAGEKIAARQKGEPEANTFAAAVNEFFDLHVRHQTPRGQKESRRPLERLLPRWGDRDLADINRLEIIDIRDRLLKADKPYAADRSLAVIRRFFRWCVDQGKLETSPATLVASPFGKGGRKRISRERWLSDQEILTLWSAFDQMAYPFGHYLKLLLVTGQRRSEVATMRWAEISNDKAQWTIPADKTKAGREHDVPLSPMALDILASCPRFNAGDYVFSSKDGTRPISDFSKAKNVADAMAGKMTEKSSSPPVQAWRLHDLRRTMTSAMAKIGIKPHILAAVLNHSPGSLHGVTAVYNRYDYLPEKRQAFEAWGRRLSDLHKGINGENVVRMSVERRK